MATTNGRRRCPHGRNPPPAVLHLNTELNYPIVPKLTIYEGIKGIYCADSNTITTAPQNFAIGFWGLNRFESSCTAGP